MKSGRRGKSDKKIHILFTNQLAREKKAYVMVRDQSLLLLLLFFDIFSIFILNSYKISVCLFIIEVYF